MAITISTGAWTSGSTSVSPALPSSPQAGDVHVLFVGCKPYSATINTPSGWTAIANTNGTNGTTANGTDVGSVHVASFYRVWQSGDGNPTVSITSGNTALACIHRFRPTSGSIINTPVGEKGSDTSSGTGYSATMGSDIGITAGDAVVSYSFIAGNNATFGSPTLAATGVTFGTVSENPATEGTTTTGYDCEASASTALPSAGPSSAAAVVGWTLSVAQTGMSNLNRIRETVNYALTANGLEITPVLANPVLSQNHALSASSAELATTPSLASPALTQNHTFIVNALTVGTPELGTPALSSYFNYSLTADAITIGTPGMGIPAISQNHAFTSIELAITPTLDGPAIAQIHALTANGPLVTPALGIPTLTQVHSLTASGIEAAPALGSPAITQYHFLTTANFTIGAPVIDEAMWSFPPSGPDDSEILLRKILIDTKWFRMVKN